MLGFCTSADFVRHLTGPQHPERPDRISAIFHAVRAAKLIDSPNPLPAPPQDLGPFAAADFKLHELTPTPAELKWIELIHSYQYIDHIRHVCEHCGVLDQGDTPVCGDSFDVALLAAGALLTCCDAVVSGKMNRAFAAVRPPGHHAEPQRPMGFCLFSNIAIAARYLQRHHGVGRIAILDFDVHHGNGTQAAFEEDPSVLFISLHQHPSTCYPGCGYEYETGIGAGEGFTLNIPLPPGTEDAEYLNALDQIALPRLDAFRPEFLLISAGFDAHRLDPLASLSLSEEGFGQITRRLSDVANLHCRGRIVSTLEGGYHLSALSHSLVRHLTELETGSRGNRILLCH